MQSDCSQTKILAQIVVLVLKINNVEKFLELRWISAKAINIPNLFLKAVISSELFSWQLVFKNISLSLQASEGKNPHQKIKRRDHLSDQWGYRSNKQATPLRFLSDIYFLKETWNIRAQEDPGAHSNTLDKDLKWKNRPNLPWLTLKKVCPGFTEQNSRGFAFSETPGRWPPWRIG